MQTTKTKTGIENINFAIASAKAQKRVALMTHIIVGYPDLKNAQKLVSEMDRVGVDLIELQIPFSDPMADGDTMRAANVKAVASGISTEDCFKFAKSLTKKVSTPLIFVGYFNSVHHYGVKKFCQKAFQAGVSGAIFPDYNIDQEDKHLFIKHLTDKGISLIPMIYPTTQDKRMKDVIAPNISTFSYTTARMGITGQASKVEQTQDDYLDNISQITQAPKSLGFGIRSPKQISQIKTLNNPPEIVVVGSAVLKELNQNGINSAISLVKKLKDAC